MGIYVDPLVDHGKYRANLSAWFIRIILYMMLISFSPICIRADITPLSAKPQAAHARPSALSVGIQGEKGSYPAIA